MKKILLLVLPLVLLTACSNKKLECTSTMNYDKDYFYKQDITVNFKEDKITNFQVKAKATYQGEYNSYLAEEITKMKEQYKKYNEYKGVKATVKSDETSVTGSLDINVTKMTNDDKKEFTFFDYSKNYEGLKETLESEGYTCK